MSMKVGFVGLGNMGMPLATNLVEAGFDVMAYDVREDRVRASAAKGAKAGNSIADIANHGEVIALAVVDDEQVQAVVAGENGLLTASSPGTVIAIHSTIHPRTVKALAETALAKGVAVVDAQMSGGAAGATKHFASWSAVIRLTSRSAGPCCKHPASIFFIWAPWEPELRRSWPSRRWFW